jgi:hypothetical protein
MKQKKLPGAIFDVAGDGPVGVAARDGRLQNLRTQRGAQVNSGDAKD